MSAKGPAADGRVVEGGSVPSLLVAFAEVPDPRRAQGRRYPLPAFLAFVCAGILAGRQGLRALVEWGEEVGVEMLSALGLKRGPALGTISELLARLDVGAFERALGAWIERMHPQHCGPRRVAIDGKTLRGSRTKELPGIHLLAVFDPAISAVLAQVAVDRKTNEHKAALDLIRSLLLEGKLVTGDAAFVQKDLCRAVIEGGGNYLLTAKENQPQLVEDLKAAFMPPDSPSGQAAPGRDRHGRGDAREGPRAPRTPARRGHHAPERVPLARVAGDRRGHPHHA